MNEFGNNLYTLRKNKGMTQQDVADKLGVTNKAVSKWETGEAFPETAQLVPLADLFGVSVDDLLRGRAEQSSDYEKKDTNVEQKQEEVTKRRKRRSRLAEKISGIIMLSATAAYLLLGFVWELWHPGWVVFPVCGIACGIILLIFDKE